MHGGQGGVVTLAAFRERADEIILHMNRFFIRYLRNLAVEFEGDLQRAILLGEIGRHGRNVPPSRKRGTVSKRRLHGRSP